MILYPKNQTYIIIPWVIGETRFPEFYAVARKNSNEKLWIWNWDGKDPILREFAEEAKLLTHEEAVEKMKTHNWQLPVEGR